MNANQADNVVAVIVMDTHASIAEGEVEGIDRVGHAEDRHDLRMTEDVKGPARLPATTMRLCSQPTFPFVNNREMIATGSYRDCGRFAVTKRRGSRGEGCVDLVLAFV